MGRLPRRSRDAAQQPPEGKAQRQLRQQDQGDAIAKIPVAGLVVEDMHPQQCAEAAAQHGEQQQRPLRDAGQILPRLVFVHPVDQKGHQIQQRQKQQEYGQRTGVRRHEYGSGAVCPADDAERKQQVGKHGTCAS